MRRPRIARREWAIAVGVVVSLLVTESVRSDPSAALTAPLAVSGYALLIASGLSLAASHRAPPAVLAVSGSCALGYQALGVDAPAVAYLVATWAAVRAGHRVTAVTTSVIMVAAVPLVLVAANQAGTVGAALTQSRDVVPLAWLIAAGAAGEALRQAERRADEAERTREQTARRRAGEERLHIARELHDALTHQISVIKVQAEVAVHLARKQGAPVPEAVLAIQEAAREATWELRVTLEVLRDDVRTPARGLADVAGLIERSRSAGVEVTLMVVGDRPDVPAAVDLAAFRVVQESLTNVARHAAATTASVRIDYRPDALVVQVHDDGTATADNPANVAAAAPPAPSGPPGVGLLGMRERVSSLGGHVSAAPRDQGGFAVRAEIPLESTS